jgi:NAD(P)H dehydrogenase (quinone)
MKHALIVAHPNTKSFTMTMATAYAEAMLTCGQDVLIRNLYRMNFNPSLGLDELPWSAASHPSADVAADRALLKDCDVFTFVYPFWFNAPPAIMKGYMERIFGNGFGYGATSHGAEPLLSGRKMMSITSSGAPKEWVESTGAMAAETALFDRHFAAVCGLTFVDHLHFGGVVPGMRPDAVDLCAEAVKSAAGRYFVSGARPAA